MIGADHPSPEFHARIRGDAGPDEMEPRKVCAWCDAVMRPGPGPTTHGMCEECRRRLLAERATRRAAIAAGLVAARDLPKEDVASVACRIDREIEAITLAEAGEAAGEGANS